MSLDSNMVLFNEAGQARAPDEISTKIDAFGYKDAVHEIICNSNELDEGGEVFTKCTGRILSNFKMTRGGPFKGVRLNENGSVKRKEILLACWERIGGGVIEVRNAISRSGYSRERCLAELGESERAGLMTKI